MSDETPRAAPSAPPVARELDDALPTSRLSQPTVPRPRPSGSMPAVSPSRKPTFTGGSGGPVSAPIPPPAPMPRVPGMDAFMVAPPSTPPAAGPTSSPAPAARASTPAPVARISAPPNSSSLDETDTGWATPVPPPANPPAGPALVDGASANAATPTSDPVAARRKSRRMLKNPDDAAPVKAAAPVERTSSPPAAEAPPPARARSSSSPWLDGFPSEPPPAPREVAAPPPPRDTSDDVIQPMRIISIGNDSPEPPVVVAKPAPPAAPPLSTPPHSGPPHSGPPHSGPHSAPLTPPPSAPPHSGPHSAPSHSAPITPPPPRGPVDIVVEEVDIDDEDPESQPAGARLESTVSPSGRAPEGTRPEEIDTLEEIEAERISDVANLTLETAAPGPKKPPPPPPKRSTTGNPNDTGPVSSATPPPAPVAAGTSPATPPPPPPTSTPTPAAAAAAVPPPAPTLDLGRKRPKPWWEELFGDDYLRTMDKVEPKVVRKECDFIEDRLGLEKGAVMLDLGCGPGAHAVELASRGYSVVGYDLSLAMLARAADEAQDRGQKLNFLQGDMREMAFEDTFDGVYCWQTSFGYFEDEKNLDVLRRVHRSLRKGGMLLLDVINHDYVAPRQPSLVWFEGDGCVCMDEMAVDFFTSRLRVKRTVMFEDGRAREVDYNIRLYALHELGKMLHECGFKVIEVTGHPAHPGVFFGSESPRVIVLAERSERE